MILFITYTDDVYWPSGRQPFHGSSSDELIFMICRGSPDTELMSSATTEDVKKIVELVTQLLQKSPKCRLVDMYVQ